MVIGIITGIVFMLLVYGASMVGYFKARKKWSEAKFAVEVVTIFVAVVISVVVKIIILAITTPQSFGSGFATVLYAIYSGLGNLTFEGLNPLSDISGSFLQCLYTSTSLYSVIMFVSVITTKASYEIYSGILLLSLKIKLKTSNKIDIFIFTSATEDSLVLANSISKTYSDANMSIQSKQSQEQGCINDNKEKYKELKGRICKIIFSGSELGTFERDNPIHRTIMSNGFIYWSFSQHNSLKSNPSILKRLGLYVDNDFENETAKAKDSRIHIFAFDNNIEQSGKESSNADLVFDEIKAIVSEINEEEKKSVFVDFYILTNSEINYEYYQSFRDKCLSNINNTKKIKKDNFALHIINEAYIVSKLFVAQRYDSFGYQEVVEDISDMQYNVMVLGFGATGQQVMLQSYIMSTNILSDDDDYYFPTQFVADVFDKNLDLVSGIFELKHPLIVCEDANIDLIKQEKIIKDKRCRMIKNMFSVLVGKTMNLSKTDKTDREATFEDIEKQMSLPIVINHNESCFSKKFIDYLDNQTGRECQKPSKYNLIIIALGDDESNIRIANGLINDIKREMTNPNNKGKTKKLQTIAINLRDEKNYERINWNSESDSKLCDNLKVVLFGNKEKIYSYEEIIDEKESIKYNNAYVLINNKEVSTESGNIEVDFEKREKQTGDYSDLLIAFNKAIEKDDLDNTMRKDWKTISVFEKESNKSAALFKNTMNAMKKHFCPDIVTYDSLRILAEIEHERWNRFYIANGWVFNQGMPKKEEGESDDEFKSKEKKIKNEGKLRKEHNCLMPYSLLSSKYNVYDVVNVARVFTEKSIKTEEKKEKYEQTTTATDYTDN